MGQRAKMSSRAWRDSLVGAGQIDMLAGADDAMAEARALLAETEPESYSERFVAPGRLPFACCDGEGTSALADALRSFVEGC